MTDEIQFTLDAGPYRRERCPTRLATPTRLEHALLFRAGRNRPVAIQANEDEFGPALWWLVDADAREQQHYRLVLNGRDRSAPARVTIRPLAAGWTVSCNKKKVAEFLAPERGHPTLSLYLGPTRIATSGFTAEPGANAPGAVVSSKSPAIHRVRIGKTLVREGPVFGQLDITYDHVDTQGRRMWQEVNQLRWYDGDERLWLLDWTISWTATTGPITLLKDGSAVCTPTLRVQAASGCSFAVQTDVGLVAPPLDARKVSSAFAILDGSSAALAAFVEPTSFGFPPRCIARADGGVELASEPWQTPYSDPNCRIPLGQSIVFRYRLAAATASAAMKKQLGERFLDFVEPPNPLWTT